MTQIELLAPAKDVECGLAAIDSGADALYIGAPRFGARAQAGNSLDDIARLADHAHSYWARVYVTVNTLLHDDELPQAVELIHRLYGLGVDAIIIQDVGLLECDLPPIPLIASTQMHNHTPERVAFLEQIGIRRAILARELSLDQIRAIRAATSSIELETFVHGALCVGYSGQCYLSYAIGGRSGNRGECAQPCRRRYSLLDRNGKEIVANRHLLSLRDLNLTERLPDLLAAGVTSFKIEGRLKDRAYVVNVVSWYRRYLDRLIETAGLARSSSGASSVEFEPDAGKTFNRGFTTFFIDDRADPPGALDSPKMVGEFIGTAVSTTAGSQTLVIAPPPGVSVALNRGDGLCWFDARGELAGLVVNDVRPAPGSAARPGHVAVTAEKRVDLRRGDRIYRNHDHAFLRQVERSRPTRKIAVRLRLEATPDGFRLRVEDEDGNAAVATLAVDKAPALKPEQAGATARKQLASIGGTPYTCAAVDLAWDQPYFLPVAELNTLRRDTLDRLAAARAANRPVARGQILRNDVPYPEARLTYFGNALNRQAVAFYRRHGVQEIGPAAESGLDMRGRVVMRSRYCLKHQLGYCDGSRRPSGLAEPLSLVDEAGHRYGVRFNCAACEMEIVY